MDSTYGTYWRSLPERRLLSEAADADEGSLSTLPYEGAFKALSPFLQLYRPQNHSQIALNSSS